MDINTLRAHAENSSEYGTDGKVQLVFPRGQKKPWKFPRGELLCENSDGNNVYLFDANRVVKWCDWVDSMEASPE